MSTTIEQQARAISDASAGQLPPEVARVFADEQQGLRERGTPAGAVGVGDTLADFTLPARVVAHLAWQSDRGETG